MCVEGAIVDALLGGEISYELGRARIDHARSIDLLR
jgi:hypothetical protein